MVANLIFRADLIMNALPFTNTTAVNVVKVRSNQEEIESEMETGEKIIESSMEIERDRTGYNRETKENRRKKRIRIVEKN